MEIQDRIKARIQKQIFFCISSASRFKGGFSISSASWYEGRFSIFGASKFSSGFIINLSDLLHLRGNFSPLDELHGKGLGTRTFKGNYCTSKG
jgi:hypothetical protein